MRRNYFLLILGKNIRCTTNDNLILGKGWVNNNSTEDNGVVLITMK